MLQTISHIEKVFSHDPPRRTSNVFEPSYQVPDLALIATETPNFDIYSNEMVKDYC